MYCTKCGKALAEGERCDCKKSGFNITKDLFADIAKTSGAEAEKVSDHNLVEKDKRIVPDCVRPDDGEQPIKQYRLAKLRSRIRGQYAEGRLQITNKRLLFRATGIASFGKSVAQEEFAVNEISGIEVKKGNRLSGLNVFAAVLLGGMATITAQGIVSTLYDSAAVVAYFCAIISALAGILTFILFKKRNWVKLLILSCAIGAVAGVAGTPTSVLDIIFNFELFSLTNVVIFAMAVLWVLALVQVCFVPNLIFTVKTNSASDAVQIRRRVWGTMFKQPQEYTGFSEVIPWEDADLVAEELGAIINDIQTIGDMAIEKWKE